MQTNNLTNSWYVKNAMGDVSDVMDKMDTDVDFESGAETTEILETMEFGLLVDCINNQIVYQTSSTMDFLTVLKGRFYSYINDPTVDEDAKTELKLNIVEVCETIITSICDEYDLLCNNISDDYVTMLEIAETLYNFFVLNKYQNVESFLIKYIAEHKHSLVESIGYDVDAKMKDITSLSNKKKNFDAIDIAVLSNINKIINFIKYGDVVEPTTVLQILDNGDLYTSRLSSYYEDLIVLGNFVPKLLLVVLSESFDTNEAVKIRNSIRTHFALQCLENNNLNGGE